MPVVQTFIISKINAFYNKKTNTTLYIDQIHLNLRGGLTIRNIVVPDINAKPILEAKSISVGINFFKLLNNEIDLGIIRLEGVNCNISKNKIDSTFNFQFIIDSFSAEKSKTADTSKSSMQVHASKIEILNTTFSYHDPVGGQSIKTDVGELSVEINKMQLDSLVFNLKNISAENAKVTYSILHYTESDTSSVGVLPEISFQTINLKDCQFVLSDEPDTSGMIIRTRSISVDSREFSLNKQLVYLNQIKADGTNFIQYSRRLKKQNSTEPAKEIQSIRIPYDIQIRDLQLSNSYFANHSAFPDLSYLYALNSLKIKNIIAYNQEFSVDIYESSGGASNGLIIKSLNGKLKLNSKELLISGLAATTPNSNIKINGFSHFNGFDSLIKSPGTAAIKFTGDIDMKNLYDLKLLAPNLSVKPQISRNLHTALSIKTKLSGTIDNLHIESFTAAASKTSIAVSGYLNDLTKSNQLSFKGVRFNAMGNGKEIKQLVQLPAETRLPEKIYLKGLAFGDLHNIHYNLSVLTNRGNIKTHGTVNLPESFEPEYLCFVYTNNLDVGYFAGKPGLLSGTAFKLVVEGRSFQPNKMNTLARITDLKFKYNGYEYENIGISATLIKNKIDGNILVNDTNLHANMFVKANIDSSDEQATIKLLVKGSDLKELGFSKNSLFIQGKSTITVKGFDKNNIIGNASFSDLVIIKNDITYTPESINLFLNNSIDSCEIKLNSSFANVSLYSNMNITKLPMLAETVISKYMSANLEATRDTTPNQIVTFTAQITDPKLISDLFIPGLESFEVTKMQGNYNSLESKLLIDVEMPLIRYNGLELKDLNLSINSNSDQLNGKLSILKLTSGNIEMPETNANVSVNSGNINVNLNIADSIKTRLDLTTAIILKGKEIQFTFPENKITLDNRVWNITPDSKFISADKKIIVPQFNMESGEESISATSNSADGSQMTTLQINSFRLETISQIISSDTLQASGKIDGKILLATRSSVTGIDTKLKITDLEYRKTAIGNLNIHLTTIDQIKYVAGLTIDGKDNSISANATYFSDTTAGSVNASVTIDRIQMKAIQAFIPSAISNVNGQLNGKLEVSGLLKSPEVTGNISFDGVKGEITALSNSFQINNETIGIKNNQLTFESFTVKDSLGNETQINGYVTYTSAQPLELNLKIVSNNFLLLNTNKEDNELYFGTLFVDNTITVRGTSDFPKIEANIKILDKSRLTFVVPEKIASTETGEGEIRFVDVHSKLDEIMKSAVKADTAIAEISGIDLIANIEINKSSTLTLLVDKQTGDSLIVQGDAVISVMIDPGGKISMTGTFEISEGSYLVSLENLVKKRFVLANGSTISWKGDIMDADLEIKGAATVNAAPLELVADQVSGLSETDLNSYRQRLPFQVILHMQGVLLKPQISFEIGLLPEDQGALNGTVYAKLNSLNQDESELNKQVFALLVLNRFIQSNPLEGGSGVQNVARNSVSKFLSQQLNAFAMQHIKGVELNFDVQSYEDYSTEQPEGKTEVNVGVTKRFMGDRLIVQVAGNVAVEGEAAKQNNMSDLAGDIVLEYLITEDGRYRLKVFRKDQYEGILDGEIKESGIGLVYTRDFDQWGQFFRRPRENKSAQ